MKYHRKACILFCAFVLLFLSPFCSKNDTKIKNNPSKLDTNLCARKNSSTNVVVSDKDSISPDDILMNVIESAKDPSLDFPEKNWSSRTLAVYRFYEFIYKYQKEGKDISIIYNELINFLEKDTYACVRAQAAEVLGVTRKKEAVPHLIRAFNDNSIFVQLNAAKSIINLGDVNNMQAIALLSKIAIGDILIGLDENTLIDAGVLKDEFLGYRRRHKSGSYATVLKERWRSSAVLSLLKSDSEYAKTVLKKMENDNNPTIRKIISEH